MAQSRKIQYLAGALEPEIDSRTPADGSVAATARTMAERYAELMIQSLPPFGLVEWQVIASAIREGAGLNSWPGVVRGYVTASARMGLEDMPRFVRQLDRLTPAEVMAAADFVERYWISGGEMRLPGEA